MFDPAVGGYAQDLSAIVSEWRISPSIKNNNACINKVALIYSCLEGGVLLNGKNPSGYVQ